MAEWRLGRGWSEEELERRFVALRERGPNFADAQEEMTLERGWHQYYSEAVIAHEPPGRAEPEGPFARGRIAVEHYEFSDPHIVIGHFDPEVPLLGRDMLLELKALRLLHFLSGVRVGAVRSEDADGRSVFGFRYDTLEGHIEAGSEWFLLTKDHATGEIRFRIQAAWRPGQFPNWWSRIGFHFVGPSYQRVWHRRAHRRLFRLVRKPGLSPPTPEEGRLVHTGPEVVFKRFRAPKIPAKPT